MTKQTIIIDNLAFAKRNERISGELNLNDCARLSTLLKDDANKALSSFMPSATIAFNLSGSQGNNGLAILTLSLQASLICLCQRCLNAMPLRLDMSYDYQLSDIAAEELLSTELDEPDDVDLQPISPHMDVVALIEDELIMAMPIAPVHEQACSSLSNQSGEKPNPFAVLKTLIKS